MKRFAWRVLVFTLSFLFLSTLWLITVVPYEIRWWFEDRWRFITELWEITGQEDTNA